MMKKISKNEFSKLFSLIDKTYELYLPIEKEGQVNFSIWEEGAQVNLEALKTDISPKETIFPQSETYLKYKKNGKKLELKNVGGKKEKYVVFGVRPCDILGFQIIDNVFLREPIDRFYEERRNKGIIISMACSSPEDTCFCNSFGVKPQDAPKTADIATWDLGDRLLWSSQTEKGKELTGKLLDILENATEKDKQQLNTLKKDIKTKLEDLPLADIKPERIDGELKDLFESKIWEKLSEGCLGCGTCTYVCPTCHCYDISDFDGGNSGERFRCWDSCMYSDFTLMAHGNIRKTQKERFRQRFMHKLVYYPNNHGLYACVGCGRCIVKCPVNLDIVKVIKKLGGEK